MNKARYDLFMIFLVLTADIAIYIYFEIEMFEKGAEYYLLTIRTVFFMTKVLIFYDFNYYFKLKNAILPLGIIFVIVFLKILNSNGQGYFEIIWFTLEYILLIGCFTIVLRENKSDKTENFSNFIKICFLDSLSPLFIVNQINGEILEKIIYNDLFEKMIDSKNNLQFSFLNDNFKNYFLVLNKTKKNQHDFSKLKIINDFKGENFVNLKELFNMLKKKKKNQIRFEVIAKQKNEKMKMKIKVMQIKAFTYYVFKLKKRKPQNDFEKIKSLFEAEKRLFCSFSHELKTPINGALPSLEIVKLNIENEEILSLLDISICSLKILNNSIDNILDHYLLESSQFFLNENKFYLQDLISEISQIISPMAIVKKINFLIQSENFKRLKIRTDYQKLKQILINILTNSVQFTYSGNIVLSFEKISISKIKFIIKDTGLGISCENLKKLLRKIKYASDDQINETGSCLGLSISEKLITYIGDSEGLIIQSEENNGTEVSFIIENNLLQDQSNFEMNLEKYKPQTYISIRNSVETCLKRSKSKKTQRNFTIISHPNTFTLNTKKTTNKTVLSSIETVEKVRNSYDFDFLIKNAKKRASFRNITLDFTVDADEMNFESRVFKKKKNPYNPFERGDQPNFNESLCDCEEILYVDDDAFNLLSLELILKSFNLKCCKLMSGKKAIETLLENSSCGRTNCKKYKLIFLDYQMPLMDGIETAIKIRELMEKNIIKKRYIIGCTAFVSKSEVLKCLEAGMREVIFKPINCNIIKSLLDEYFYE